jgi:hypothetical protein
LIAHEILFKPQIYDYLSSAAICAWTEGYRATDIIESIVLLAAEDNSQGRQPWALFSPPTILMARDIKKHSLIFKKFIKLPMGLNAAAGGVPETIF